ncbi:MAG TPA: hypothetical protein VFA77_11670 [Candidatus Eisenbacteria bacterium]|nr:hypothetical protein [Candidatus Eisenbacteria bacterium]
MSKQLRIQSPVRIERSLTSELLILPDGRILVHNLTPPMATLLLTLNPDDEVIGSRIETDLRATPDHSNDSHEFPN